MDNFPALTVKQPWARLIMLGVKNVENRSWTTDYRGRIFIHAGKGWDSSPWPDDPGLVAFGSSYFRDEEMARGAILGTVELYNIVEDSASPWAEKSSHHWLIRNPRPFFRPLPWRGQMGLWWPTRFSA